MGKYFKIGNLFDGGIGFSVRHTSEQVMAGTHAINSHDELVVEVERLRGKLQDAYLDGCHAGWDMSGEGYNAEYGGPEDGAMHDMFVTKSIEYMK